MTAYLERMPSGIPGMVTRKADSVLEPGIVGANPLTYGAPVKISGGKLVALEAGDDASDLYGFLARPFPTQSADVSSGPGTAPAGAVRDALRSGYLSVKLATGTAAKDGTVYVRVAASAGKVVGAIEAAADPGTAETTLAIEGAPDANTGNATIGTLSVEDGAKVGAYKAVCTAATVYSVYDPDGLLMRADGAFGSAFSAGGVAFTITAGATPCVAGDSFTITVTSSTETAPAGNVAVNAQFMGPADADGNVEIAYNI